jgi:hypothetical protein
MGVPVRKATTVLDFKWGMAQHRFQLQQGENNAQFTVELRDNYNAIDLIGNEVVIDFMNAQGLAKTVSPYEVKPELGIVTIKFEDFVTEHDGQAMYRIRVMNGTEPVYMSQYEPVKINKSIYGGE